MNKNSFETRRYSSFKLIFIFFVTNGLRQAYQIKTYNMKQILIVLITLISLNSFAQDRVEVNDANARLQIWRSLLSIAVAKGNLNLFTEQLK